MSRIAVALLTLCLAACGMRGSLVLPPGPAPAPLLDKLKPATSPQEPAKAAVSNGNDVSTDQKTSIQ